MVTAFVATVGFCMYKTYDSYRKVNMSEADLLLAENVLAIAEENDDDIVWLKTVGVCLKIETEYKDEGNWRYKRDKFVNTGSWEKCEPHVKNSEYSESNCEEGMLEKKCVFPSFPSDEELLPTEWIPYEMIE